MIALLLPLALLAHPGEPTADAEEPRPHILFILTDDQRHDAIGAWGNPAIQTPHIDRIAAQGTSFRRNYCMGSAHGAVCAPSRAMIHTGRAYHSIDHSGMTGTPLLGEGLRDRGYRTVGVGKWHNGQDSFKRSFDEGRAVMFGGMSDHFDVPLRDVGADGEVTEREKVRRHSSDLFAEAAVEFLRSAGTDQPFFLKVALTAPHDPRDAPPKWLGRERPALPANFLPQHPFDNGHMTLRDEKLAAWPRDPGTVRQQLAAYYGLIEHMDRAIGEILGALDARDDDRPTVIIFAADHGLALGSHGLLGKQSVYEHSLRAPLILSGPGIPKGHHVTALTYLLDLYPTLLGLAGPPIPAAPEEVDEVEGGAPADQGDARPAKPKRSLPDGGGYVARDLAPLWRGERAAVRSSVYLAMGKTQRAVTDGRWKLCVYPRIGHRQLFDLASDPHEMINLAGNPTFDSTAARLMTELETWRERTGDADPLVVDEPGPMEIDLSGRERKPDRWQPEWIRKAYFDEPEEDRAEDR